ncbi:MAG: DUF3089 domain-containing protein [Bacteroidota bacterium]
MKYFLQIFLILGLFACHTAKPKIPFSSASSPTAPDYRQDAQWAALPERADPADRVPSPSMSDGQATAGVDVFFLHPTTYTGYRGETNWNAPLDATSLNERTDRGTILHQSSIFNAAARVYAPRYRQAHYEAFFSADTSSANAALDLAYRDVRAAFEYYLEHYNRGRPILIAAHSQGTRHGVQLLREFFDGQPLQAQLVAAYLVGLPVRKTEFEGIPPCATPTATGCFCAWRTFKRGHYPKGLPTGDHIAVTNPLNWSTDGTYAGFEQNQGGVLRNFDRGPRVGLTDAQVERGLLWAAKPRFFGKIFITFKNYHVADYNLYYANVRQNAQERITAFLEGTKPIK